MRRKDPERMLIPKPQVKGVPPSHQNKDGGGRGLPCPLCGEGTITIDSRPRDAGIRRRRCCVECGHRFTTWEIVGHNPLLPKISLQTVAHELRQLTERFERLAEMNGESDADEDAAA